MLYLYNSATRTKEPFVPHDPQQVTMYTCGPTVYHFAHIGNLRTYIMEDVLDRYLRYSGYHSETSHEYHRCGTSFFRRRYRRGQDAEGRPARA